MTRTGCSKRRRAGTHGCFEDDVAKDTILERCTKAAYKRWFRSTRYVRDKKNHVARRELTKKLWVREVYISLTSWYWRQYYDEVINWASRCLSIINIYMYIDNSRKQLLCTNVSIYWYTGIRTVGVRWKRYLHLFVMKKIMWLSNKYSRKRHSRLVATAVELYSNITIKINRQQQVYIRLRAS